MTLLQKLLVYLNGFGRLPRLQGANLRGANLLRANLQGANLRGTNLQGANLQGVNLRGANLLWANLRGADLRGADLRGANLLWADLQGTKTRMILGLDRHVIQYPTDMQIGCERHTYEAWESFTSTDKSTLDFWNKYKDFLLVRPV